MENNLRNRTETPNSIGLDWLWILWATLYAAGFGVVAMLFPLENPPVAFCCGLVALAALKYLIRFTG